MHANAAPVEPLIGLQTPRVENPISAASAASSTECIELAAAYGLVLDPWQCHVIRGALGERPDGRWAASRVGLSVPRQNGKNAVLEARHLFGLVLSDERLLIHSAHEVKTALEAFERIKSYFENFDDLGKLVARITVARGSEEIRMRDGRRLRFFARSKGGGRGFSPDALFLDEAQHLPEPAFAALLPSLSARPNPQLWFTGTPPTPDQDGAVFERQRTAALEGSQVHYWAEWSAEPDLDHDDVTALAQANPALGIRQTVDFAEAERADMTDEAYGRERLGKWDNVAAQYVISPDQWDRLKMESADPSSIGTVALGVDVAPNRSVTCISLAGYVEDLGDDLQPHTYSLVASTAHRDGVGWAVEYIASRWDRGDVRAVVIDTAGPAASLIEPLRARGVLVTTTGTQQYGAACGMFYDATTDNELRHAGQPALASAVAAARKRRMGESWAWNRKDATSDITPLVSSTLALYGLVAENIAKPKATPKGPRQPRTSNRMYAFN